MTTKVSLYSERKGSNPGGKCSVTIPRGGTIDAYIKYCPGSRLPRYSPFKDIEQPFRASHQPIYEALTLVLAQQLGLVVPQFYVLDNTNPNNRVQFSYTDDSERINEQMPYYFVSKLIVTTKEENPEARRAALAREKLYRDLLVVSDISNKAQNYMYTPDIDRMTYLDLGCSFVNAVEGELRPHAGRQKLPSKKEWRGIEKKLNNCLVETMDGRTLELRDLLNIGEKTLVPMLNPRGYRRLGKLLPPEEIEETSLIIKSHLLYVLKKHKNDSRICIIK